MQNYRLVSAPDRGGRAKRVEFRADDPADAFELVAREFTGERAELWADDSKLCLIERRPEGFWTVAPASPMREPMRESE